MEKIIESNDGMVIATYDTRTHELLTIEDWNGNDLTGTKWESIASEKLNENLT